MGLDIGSTTIKLVLLPEHSPAAPAGARPDPASVSPVSPVFAEYRRHNADVRGELSRLLGEVARVYPGAVVRGAVTGSAGLSLATLMGLPFVQEVIAETETVRVCDPQADVVIELGGEDAKITYLHPTPEQRMNGTCAGGTGAFIDQMAQLLHTDAAGLDDMASRYTTLYPIASRCGVFAKSDLQPLINQGAAGEDLAASVLQAVVTQTIAGLACGRPIRGHVMFLGGPLHFLPQLRAAFERTLADQVDSFTCPDNAQLYVAIGAALLSSGEPTPISELSTRLATRKALSLGTSRMRPLFKDTAELEAFRERHARAHIERAHWPVTEESPEESGPEPDGPDDELDAIDDEGPHAASGTGGELRDGDCFLGIDAGSTTIKAVVLDGRGRIVWEHYAGNEGDPVTAAVEILRRIHREMPDGVRIVRSCVTGYGESLVKAALRIDEGVVETMAHYRAAAYLNPGVTSVIDIGGQDMKYLRIKGDAIDSISVNEACSAGCGSFLQTFARSMGLEIGEFAEAALHAERPVDLGSRCTVFMNSSVKQAQRESATVGEISAGLSYSVVRNALYKVIKLKDADQLGERVSVQGGTFLNDAVLRAFELLTGREVVRPDVAGLMGCFGAALSARATYDGVPSGLMSLGELSRFSLTTETATCKLCQNHCQLTITTFNDGQRHISGNRCERGATQERRATKSDLPNLYDYKYKRAFSYRRLLEGAATRGDIGIPRVLGMYENYPLWFTVLTSLGFRVMISGRSNHELFESGMDTIPSENVCYPAKLAHGHIEALIAKGITTIWFPCVFYERELVQGAADHFNCPIVATYPEVIRNNVEAVRDGQQEGPDGAEGGTDPGGSGVRMLSPFLNLADPATLAERLVEVFADWGVTLPEARRAVAAGFAEDAAFKADVRAEGRRALRWMEDNGRKGIVLAGRPYHIDPEINHGVPDVINTLGLAVLSEDSLLPEPDAAAAEAADTAETTGQAGKSEETGDAGKPGRPGKAEPEGRPARPARPKKPKKTDWAAIARQAGSSPGTDEAPDPGDGAEHAVATGALSRAVAALRRRVDELRPNSQAPADWSDVTGVGLPTPKPVATQGVTGRLRVRDQWAYHSRLYQAAELVTTRDDLELVQLNSFGCGVDALTTDQVQEILESAGGVYTSLKIDEVSNLGAATIRLRSLAAASEARAAERAAQAEEADGAVDDAVEIDTTAPAERSAARTTERGEARAAEEASDRGEAGGAVGGRELPGATSPVFTEAMRATHTILMPQMSPVHFRPLEPLMRRLGYQVELLESATRDDLEVGLRYVNNDACFPAIMVIGQLIGAFTDGSHDPDSCVVAISQTGGICRATNYAAMLRKGLREAGYPQVPVVAISLQGIESNPGFELTATMGLKMLQGIIIGDTLNTCLLRVRPYEVVEGATQELVDRWNRIIAEYFEHKGRSATWGGRIGYRRLLREMVREFNDLPRRDEPRRPRVGVVGEILVKFQPDANNHVIDVIEAEGCEATVPGLLPFFLSGLVTAQWEAEAYGIGKESVAKKKAAVWFIEQLQAPARAALRAAGGTFDIEPSTVELARKASKVLSLGNQAGEGWLLTGEMIELIEHGVPNIVCCQPFACLPNHVVGKGMFREVRRRYPQANIVAIDYDPGASEVNQLNRIKLMISTALMAQDGTEPGASERADRQPEDVPGSMAGEELLAGLGPVPDGTPSSPDVAGAERHRSRSRVRSR
ncbi:CoA activase [Actinomyces naeslundii]|uniref:acyl-CoA dehydratase activase-related protein n=1 Tax=Actinomyces naeslundii TaxID=1655 RepID=UPI00096D3EEE|nr:acyl-CoA dehydratase activase-related protein [Actinomyces naeslundii]OMG30306.1 CoA activase [Actinomyces naeslundii]OMG40411.1 CoA activase [Actinomyces naeslundii]